MISLLYLDFDLYEPTLAELKYFLPRMPKSTILLFDELAIPEGIHVAVMINAQEYIDSKLGVEPAISSVFVKKINSPIDIVRIASCVINMDSCKKRCLLVSIRSRILSLLKKWLLIKLVLHTYKKRRFDHV